MSSTKQCRECKEILPQEDFYKQSGGDGYEPRCKTCKSDAVYQRQLQRAVDDVPELVEVPVIEMAASTQSKLQFYKEQLDDVQKDIKSCRSNGNFSALSNLYTKAQQFREAYDALQDSVKEEAMNFESMEDGILISEIAGMISALPDLAREELLLLVGCSNGSS